MEKPGATGLAAAAASTIRCRALNCSMGSKNRWIDEVENAHVQLRLPCYYCIQRGLEKHVGQIRWKRPPAAAYPTIRFAQIARPTCSCNSHGRILVRGIGETGRQMRWKQHTRSCCFYGVFFSDPKCSNLINLLGRKSTSHLFRVKLLCKIRKTSQRMRRKRPKIREVKLGRRWMRPRWSTSTSL